MRRSETAQVQRWGQSGVLAIVIFALIASAGCTRRFYRNRADREVAEVLAEKDVVPFWKIENYGVYPDDRARFADPTKPDRPPMPPDDPAARMLSPNPQRPKHAGVGRYEGTGYLNLLAAWDAFNRNEIAPPDHLAPGESSGAKSGVEIGPAPRAVEGELPCAQRPFLITLEQAVELGIINSREFQTKREDLYLAALPVTLERFGFAFQFFAMEEAIREYTGANTGFGKGDHWRLNSDAGFTKLFSTGALLLVSYANRTVIDLSGRMKLSSISTLNLDLIQPLLRGGGRAVTLEPLTQVERNLLYEIRDYARFRKEFYQYITGGGDLTTFRSSPNAAFGRAFSPGSVSLNSGNPARPQLLPGGSGRVLLGVGAAPLARGYLPTVLSKGNITIDEQSVKRQDFIYKLFQDYEEGGEVSPLQVGQVQLQLLDAENKLLKSNADYGDSLDQFKLQLGVPPPVPLELDDGFIRPLLSQFERFDTILEQSGSVIKALEKYDSAAEVAQLRPRVELLFTDTPLARGTKVFKATIEDRWKAWRKDQLDDKQLLAKLENLGAEKRRLLYLKSYVEQPEQAMMDLSATTLGLLAAPLGQGPWVAAFAVAAARTQDRALSPAEKQALARTLSELSLGEMERTLRFYERMPWQQELKKQDQVKRQAEFFQLTRHAVVDVLGEATNERMEMVRAGWQKLPGVELGGIDLARNESSEATALATQFALDNRLELMNARAELVDAWRQVAIYANSLLGVFNVGYHMDSSTPPDEAQPLAFQPSRTRHQLFLNAELPLVRLAERNNYRAALIGYQRARRSLMTAEDLVAAQVRSELRQLQLLYRSYEIQRESLEIAVRQLDSSLETFRAPQAPGAGQNAGSVAALTQQLTQAYANLPRVQKQLLSIWVQYQVARQQLVLDLELMPVDSRGVWNDELSARPRPISVADTAGTP